jgi:hypothetical protein
MGACCSRLESIDHAYYYEDLQYIAKLDLEMISHQLTIIKADTVTYQL